MKKLLTFLLIGTMFGCGVINLNNTTKKECSTKKECCKKNVKMDPQTVAVFVINKTDQPIYWHRTMGMDKNDVYDTIPANGGTLLSNSNTQPPNGATSFIGTINKPLNCTGGPQNGSWNFVFGFDGTNQMKFNYANEGGSPSAVCPATATKNHADWAYTATWSSGNCYKSKTNSFKVDTVTFTTSLWPKTEEEGKGPLTFNEMVTLSDSIALSITPEAVLYEASARPGVRIIETIYRGNDEWPSLTIGVSANGLDSVQKNTEPYLECLPIPLPVKMTLEEAEEKLQQSKYAGTWEIVVLRAPLGPVKLPPLYIFTVEEQGYIAVNTWTGMVSPLTD